MGSNPEKIYVAGHAGLVGSAIVRQIEKVGKSSWIGATRSEFNLCDRESVFDFMQTHKPDAVIIAAAKVGGIVANSTFPVEFLSENVQVQTNLMDAAHQFNVENLVFLGSSCIYPRDAAQPIKEESLLTGKLEESNEAYAIAKIAGLKLVEAYRKQFGMRWISAMPTNVYGPGDKYDLESGHVLPSLLHKFYLAKQHNDSSVTLWGSGSPLREFIYSDDLANALLVLLKDFDEPGHINIGSGREISIRDLAELIADIVGFEGSIFWDHSMPNGTPQKLLDSTKILGLGWSPKVSLEDGIRKTYESLTNRNRLT
jgi:GDP-L-fucose synthase